MSESVKNNTNQSTETKTDISEETFKYATSSTNTLLVARIFVTLISLIVIFSNIEGDMSFFKSLTIFSLSQLLYAIGIKGQTAMRSIFEKIVFFIVGAYFMIGLLGLMNIITIYKSNSMTILSCYKFEPLNFVSCPITYVFWIMGVTMLIIFICGWITSLS